MSNVALAGVCSYAGLVGMWSKADSQGTILRLNRKEFFLRAARDDGQTGGVGRVHNMSEERTQKGIPVWGCC